MKTTVHLAIAKNMHVHVFNAKKKAKIRNL